VEEGLETQGVRIDQEYVSEYVFCADVPLAVEDDNRATPKAIKVKEQTQTCEIVYDDISLNLVCDLDR